MARPLVGIEVDLEANASGRRYAKCYEAYFDQVAGAGGAPVLLPPSGAGVEGEVLARLDAVVVPGGDDFHASEWGEEQRPCARYVAVDARRLAHGKRLIRAVLELGLPFLGVCYGEQLLALACGGTLVQDVPDEVEGALDHRADHRIEVAPGTLLERLCGRGELEVNSRHHQAVRRPGEGLVVSARAADGVVEAIEAADGRFLLGVQWHPEGLEGPAGSALFEGLVEAARARRLLATRS